MVEIPFGERTILLNEPSGSVILMPAAEMPNSRADMKRERMLVEEAIQSPIGRLPLREWVASGDRIVIVIPDITRKFPASTILALILEILEDSGIDRGNIRILLANGNHRPNTDEEIRGMVGDAVLERCIVKNHDPQGDLAYIGRTSSGNETFINRAALEADKIILAGIVSFHTFAGFSGGRKGILPGISGRETILFNHGLMINDDNTINDCANMGILEHNPVHADMMEAMGLLGTERIFLLNVVNSPYGGIAAAYAGCPITAFQMACNYLQTNFSVLAEGEFDIVVCSCGGYPLDISFYQAFKGICTGTKILRSGGVLFLIAGCKDGFGEKPEKFRFWFSLHTKQVVMQLKKEFDVVGRTVYDIKKQLDRGCSLYLVTDFEKNIAQESGMIQIQSNMLEETLGMEIKRREATAGKKRICIIPYGQFPVIR